MKLILFTIPTYYFEQQMGVPRLVSYMKKRGYNVVLRNLNYEFFYKIFTERWLKRIYENKKNEKKIKSFLNNQNPLDFLKKVSQANETLDKNFGTLKYSEFFKNFEILEVGAKFISVAYRPTFLSLVRGIDMDYSPFSSGEIVKATNDYIENFLIGFYEEEVIPYIRKEKPDLIGISMGHMNQFIPGFTLMRLIKKYFKTYIIIGGTAVTHLCRFFSERPTLQGFFDFVAIGPGEYALQELMEKLPYPNKWHTIPNFMYREGVKLTMSKLKKQFDLNDAETPEYYEPRPRAIIAIETSQNCYWGKCSFCHWPCMHDATIPEKREPYQERDLELVEKDLQEVKEKYDPLFIRLSDAVVSPDRLNKLIDINKKFGFKFYTYIRAEEEFTSLDFCRKIYQGGLMGAIFGIESGSERINNFYNKGVSLKTVEKILENFNKVGIIGNIFSMINFPDETEEEMLKSYEYFKRLIDKYSCLLFMGDFKVFFKSDVWNNYKKFGIVKIKPRPVSMYFDFDSFHSRKGNKSGIVKIKPRQFKVWIRGREDLPLYYTCDIALGKKAERRKEKLLRKIMRELTSLRLWDRFFLKVFKNYST